MKTIDKIDNFFKDMFNLSENKILCEKEINAKDLIKSNRIDLIAKLKYIEYFDKKYKTDYFKDLYRATINAFSDGTYKEPGNKEKNNFNKYIESFNQMIIDIKKNNFDKNKSIIPISKNNVLLDGSHRTSICAYFDKKIQAAKFDVKEKDYDLNYFKYKCLDRKYLDYLCLEYSKLKNNIYVICLWPNCYEKWYKNIKEQLYSKLNVIYEKDISFSYNGFKNLMIQIYRNDDWVGNINNKYNGIYQKVDKCYDKNKTCFFVVEEDDFNKIQEVKKDIRNEINLGNHSIHTTDNIDESINILNLILNNNSINMLERADLYKYKKTYNEINEIKEKLKENNISFDKLVLDGSVVLSIYGLRENKDIDILISDEYGDKIDKMFDIHNNEVDMYNETVDNIIYNPNNYFYFDGLKFVSLELLKVKKEQRYKVEKNKKDKRDIELINSVLVKQDIFKKIIFKIKIFVTKLKIKLKRYIRIILKKIGLYKLFEKIWRKIKRKK